MFRPAGLLSGVVCPAFRDGACEGDRVQCPYSHDLRLLEAQVQEAKRRKLEETPAKEKSAPPAKAPARAPPAAAPGGLECPVITSRVHPASSKISLGARKNGIQKIFGTLSVFYKPLLAHADPTMRTIGADLCTTDARSMEADVFRLASEHSYRNSSMSAAMSVTKRNKEALAEAADEACAAVPHGGADAARAIMLRCTETGTNAEVMAKRKKAEDRKAHYLTRERVVKAGFLCPKGDLQTLGYLTEIPAAWGPGGDRVNGAGEKQTCARCGTLFLVAPLQTAAHGGQDPEACRFHPGRPRREEASDGKRRKVQRWTCCGRTVDTQALGDDRCATGPHVFKEDAEEALHHRAPYTTFAQLAEEMGGSSGALDLAALDCEMSYTTQGLSVTRITLIDESGEIVFDELVRCTGDVAVLDFNTQFSGIQPEEYEANAVLDIEAARRALACYVGPNTVLVRCPADPDWPWPRKRSARDSRGAHDDHRYVPALSASPRPAVPPRAARPRRQVPRQDHPGRRLGRRPLLSRRRTDDTRTGAAQVGGALYITTW